MSFRYRDQPHVAMDVHRGRRQRTAGLYHEVLNMAGRLQRAARDRRREQSIRVLDAVPAGVKGEEHFRPRRRLRSADDNRATATTSRRSHAVAIARRCSARCAGDGPSLIEAQRCGCLAMRIHDGAEHAPRELLADWGGARSCHESFAAGWRRNRNDETARRDRSTLPGRGGDAVAFGEASPTWPDPSTVTHGVYADSQESGRRRG